MDWFGHSRYFLLGEGIRLHAFKKISIVIRFVTLRDTNRSIMNNERGCLWYKKDNKFKIPKGVIVFVSTVNISCTRCLIAKQIE